MIQKISHLPCLSFWQLLKRSCIEIPILQRDYAHGRNSSQRICDAFLSTLVDAIEGSPLELDFIYGELRDGIFLPIDGQQRLTTLFLLHWYAVSRNVNNDSSAENGKALERLQRFSYRTRLAARDFCKVLIEQIKTVSEPQSSLSCEIVEKTWFMEFWREDPTVRGMLSVLDRIQDRFGAIDAQFLWGKLVEDTCPITFHYIEIPGLGISDDLYIKMNARGKPLTQFEIFKCELQEKVASEGWESLCREEDSFRSKADTQWADFIWQLIPEMERPNRWDDFYLSFFLHSWICSTARIWRNAESSTGLQTQERLTEKIRHKIKDSNVFTAEDFSEFSFCEVCKHFDLLKKYHSVLIRLDRSLTYWGLFTDTDSRETSVLAQVLDNTKVTTFAQRLILYGQMAWLVKNAESAESAESEPLPEGLCVWMRLIRNLVFNAGIDDAEGFVRMIALIDELIDFGDIAEVWSEERFFNAPKFASFQLREERLKFFLKGLHPELNQILERMEDTAFCKGRIDIALYCLTGDHKYEESFCLNASDFCVEKLITVSEVIIENFTEDNLPKIRQALLTIEDPCPQEGMPRYFFEYWCSYIRWREPILLNYALIQDFNDFVQYSRNLSFRCFLSALVEKLVKAGSLDQIIAGWKASDASPEWQNILLSKAGDRFWKNASCNAYFAFSEDFLDAYTSRVMIIQDTLLNRKYYSEDSENRLVLEASTAKDDAGMS